MKNSVLSSDVVGLTIHTVSLKYAVNVAKTVKEIDPKIPLVIGGPHCTFTRNHSLNDVPYADISVMGEGEHVIIDIVEFFQGRKKLSDIHGIYYRENGRVKKGKPLEVIEDLDSIDFPARHLVEKYDYGKINKFHLFKPKVTALLSSRGCPFKCSFCVRYSSVIKNWGFRQRSAENVVKEIIEIDKKYGSVLILDDNFLADRKRAHEIFDKLIKSKTKIHLLIEGSRVDSAERSLYLKMKKANVKYIGYGIESGNQNVLDFYRKGFNLDQARKAVRLSREMGFITNASFILGAPSERKKQIENTINFACSLPLDAAIFYPLHYTRHSAIWNDAVKNKKILNDELDVIADKRRDLSNFTADELWTSVNKAYKRFYLRPGYIFYQIYQALLKQDFRMLKNGLSVIANF